MIELTHLLYVLGMFVAGGWCSDSGDNPRWLVVIAGVFWPVVGLFVLAMLVVKSIVDLFNFLKLSPNDND